MNKPIFITVRYSWIRDYWYATVGRWPFRKIVVDPDGRTISGKNLFDFLGDLWAFYGGDSKRAVIRMDGGRTPVMAMKEANYNQYGRQDDW